MNIVLLGSGNVATHLGLAFSDAGHSIVQVWSRNIINAALLADRLGAKAIDQLDELTDEGDIYIISVLDDAIPSLVEQLKHLSAPLVHTSGSTDMQVLAPFSSNYGVLYPLQTFSKSIAIDLSHTPFLLEASNEEVLGKLEALASSVSTNLQYCNSEQRIKLHIAAVFSCNFSNHLYAIAQELLSDSHLDFDLIRPLILQTAEKVMDALPSDVQTGPAVRRDQLTLGRHREQLVDHPEWLRIYNLLSDDIIKKIKT
jgi:predicted short-subunit dehydrogenase-like oxidoreductase (DUF2520 family)